VRLERASFSQLPHGFNIHFKKVSGLPLIKNGYWEFGRGAGKPRISLLPFCDEMSDVKRLNIAPLEYISVATIDFWS
jgi:hypothetical protein